MSVKNLVICDKELCYANTLAENIAMREELNVSVYTFTSLEKAFLFSQNTKIHMLIVDEAFEGYERAVFPAEIRFLLVHGGEVEVKEGEIPIYKYQAATQIIQSLFETYAREKDVDFFRKFTRRRTRLEAFYSPVRGIGKTRYAISLGRELAKKEKILYLNMEEYPGFELEMTEEEEMNLGDLLYYLKQSSSHLGLKLPATVKKLGDMDYVPPIFLSVDLKEVTATEWKEFLEQILSLGLYDRILLDVGESVQGLFQILEFCDKVYLPIKESECSFQKLHRYEKCLEKLKLERILSITERVVLPERVEEYVKELMKEDE